MHKLARLDHAHLWHPFTQMREWLGEEPLVIVEGRGCWLVDAQGRRYLDGVSSLWCNVHGHRHPTLDASLSLGSVPALSRGTETERGRVDPIAETCGKAPRLAPAAGLG